MNRGGFSIVEMLVVVSITILLSSLAISYNRSSDRQLRVFREQARIVNLINRAKVLAVERFNDPPNSEDVCGVGFRTENNKDFLIYQDLDSTGNNCDSSGDQDERYSGADEDIENYSLPERVEFTEPASEGLEVLFIPPHLNVTSTRAFPVSFGVKSMDGSESVTISVSAVGQVSTTD